MPTNSTAWDRAPLPPVPSSLPISSCLSPTSADHLVLTTLIYPCRLQNIAPSTVSFYFHSPIILLLTLVFSPFINEYLRRIGTIHASNQHLHVEHGSETATAACAAARRYARSDVTEMYPLITAMARCSLMTSQ